MKHEVWPPLITAARQPRWMVWRDRGLTLFMWLLFVLVCHNFLRLAADGVREVSGRPRVGPEWDPEMLWEPLRPFLVVSGLLVTWLLLFGLVGIRRIARDRARPMPPPLDTGEEAARQGADGAALAAWRDWRIAVVHLDDHGRMHAEPGPPPE